MRVFNQQVFVPAAAVNPQGIGAVARLSDKKRKGTMSRPGQSKLSDRGWRRIYASLLLPLLLLAWPAVLQAQFDYSTDNGTITITGYTGPEGEVFIPDRINGLPVTSIGIGAFAERSGLNSVTIPNTVTIIADLAFYYCYGLTSVTIPNSVTRIGDAAFGECYGLTSVTIPNSVTRIGEGAFSGCSDLTSIAIGNSVTSIGDYAFYECGLTSVTIPNAVTSIGDEAFGECYGLTSVSIGDSVTRIGARAFYFCFELTFVTIPKSVTRIGDEAFGDCSSLTAITVEPANPAYSSADGVLFDKSLTTLLQCPGDKAGSYAIPSSVTSIGHNAFNYCNRLTSVTIPNSVTRIGEGAFSGCSDLTSIAIGNSVTSIGDYAFYDCGLTSVTLPNGVIRIGNEAFYGCTGLTSVYFRGDAPGFVSLGVFGEDPNATLYYLPGTRGWGGIFLGRPTAPWVLPDPVILNFGPSFGVDASGFGFLISWATHLPVVVEACTNLGNPNWSPLATNTLTDGSSYFSDPQWTNHPNRFYRVLSP